MCFTIFVVGNTTLFTRSVTSNTDYVSFMTEIRLYLQENMVWNRTSTCVTSNTECVKCVFDSCLRSQHELIP